MCGKFPFLLQPFPKGYIWGGTRLNDDYEKKMNILPLAETWECSTHPDGQSIIKTGQFKGWRLGDFLKKYPEYLGSHPRRVADGEFPILVKLIDAKENLSIQVHPDDEYAWKQEKGQLGKTEMWYVLHAKNGARLAFGFKQDVEKKQIRAALESGTVEKYLQYIPVHKDDVFLVEAGTVHAIGAGVVLAEIQENSNLTYRLYDYGRVDRKGKKRPLHIDKALDVVKCSAEIEPRQPMRIMRYKRGCAIELLCRCKYFQTERILLNTECCRDMVRLKVDSMSFKVLLCVEGCGSINGTTQALNFFKGDCIFVPADSAELKLHGRAQLLCITC